MSDSDLAALGGWKAVLGRLADGEDLTEGEAAAAMGEILAGDATPAQIAAFITALRMKGETVDEMVGMVEAMLGAAQLVDLRSDAVDIVGTGGAPRRREAALNVSTMASFVAAGAGATVCKHGNRRASSTSGSFDLLEELGVTIDLPPEGVVDCIEQVGLGFVFARGYHPAMRHAAPVRAELGIPTVFNFLGPLSHPGRLNRQVIGVADPNMADRVAGVLQRRGATRAMVVYGHDHLDELTIATRSTIHELRDGDLWTWEFDPTELGIDLVPEQDLPGGDAAENARLAHALFAGEPGPVREIVALNAAAALIVAGLTDDLPEGLRLARASIDEGKAQAVLERLVEVSAAAGS